MAKKPKAAIAAGAKTDEDFVLFSLLSQRLKGLRRFLKDPKARAFHAMYKRQEIIMERGHFFNVAPLPKGFRRGKGKECYYNTWKLVLGRTNAWKRAAGDKGALFYCEGFVFTGLPIDIDHGWRVDTEGNVIDVTLREMGLSYFGIKYRMDELDVDTLPILDNLAMQALCAL